jgi:hypothetical protein
VQAYPAVEYDFTPQNLHVRTGDYIHIQWTGAQDGAYPNGQVGVFVGGVLFLVAQSFLRMVKDEIRLIAATWSV